MSLGDEEYDARHAGRNRYSTASTCQNIREENQPLLTICKIVTSIIL